MGRGAALGLNLIIVQLDRVVSGAGSLRGLVVGRAVAVYAVVVFFSRHQFQRACRGHHQEVSQVAEPAYAAHLRESKAFYRRVLVAVSRAVVAAGDGVRADLHHAPRGRGARKGFPQAMIGSGGIDVGTGPDKGIDIVCGTVHRTGVRSGSGASRPERQGTRDEHDSCFSIHKFLSFYLIIFHSCVRRLPACQGRRFVRFSETSLLPAATGRGCASVFARLCLTRSEAVVRRFLPPCQAFPQRLQQADFQQVAESGHRPSRAALPRRSGGAVCFFLNAGRAQSTNSQPATS